MINKIAHIEIKTGSGPSPAECLICLTLVPTLKLRSLPRPVESDRLGGGGQVGPSGEGPQTEILYCSREVLQVILLCRGLSIHALKK